MSGLAGVNAPLKVACLAGMAAVERQGIPWHDVP
jgi:hypothetical protein